MSKASSPRTKEEVDATVAKLLAEASKAAAEAMKATKEAEEVANRVRSSDAQAIQDELKLKHVLEIERKRLAKNDEYRIYHFDTSVRSDSVESAVATLTEWHRLTPDCDIEIIFNSPGGSVIDGFVLFDFLVDLGTRGHKVTTGCTGMAASMAGILLQAGKHRWMSRESWYLIHQAAFGAMGKTFEIEDTVDWIKRIQTRILNIFAARSTLTVTQLKKKWERKDWWIDSDEALKLQLVDEVRASSLPSSKPNA